MEISALPIGFRDIFFFNLMSRHNIYFHDKSQFSENKHVTSSFIIDPGIKSIYDVDYTKCRVRVKTSIPLPPYPITGKVCDNPDCCLRRSSFRSGVGGSQIGGGGREGWGQRSPRQCRFPH